MKIRFLVEDAKAQLSKKDMNSFLELIAYFSGSDIMRFIKDKKYFNKILDKKINFNMNELEKAVNNTIMINYPIPYYFGFTFFDQYKLFLEEGVYIPKSHTCQIAQKSLKIIKDYFKETQLLTLSEFCAGTGAWGIFTYLKLKLKKVNFFEYDDASIKYLKKNTKYHFVNSEIFKSDKTTEALKHNIKADVIIMNPPYLFIEDKNKINNVKYEKDFTYFSKNAGNSFYEDVIKNADKILNKKGLIIFEGSAHHEEKLKEMISKIWTGVKMETKKIIHATQGPLNKMYVFKFGENSQKK